MAIGIMGAMPEEIEGLAEILTGSVTRRDRGLRAYHEGRLFGRDAVLVHTRCGKVAAATTAAHLILEHGVTEIYFTGVAGAADSALNVGDIVIATSLCQHDMDASPLFPRHEIPLLGVSDFPVEPQRCRLAVDAARRFLRQGMSARIPAEARRAFHLSRAKVVEGVVASGDKFFASQVELDELKVRLPEVQCVEMEGAAVAQVCYEYGVPLTVIRTISDSANEKSAIDFSAFIRDVARHFSHGVLEELLGERRDNW